ncbi:carbohydrate ABC transporter permease [Microlunatus soli]|uniref:Carbohydrate ABC transporter membrane protein 2, CUT1 family n=1 Tax=Microlunatus soli TaxID=630515 RepID=A0A1H1U3F4_9ACTN|nr:carbohydrate ABC transporter permease [Microlunatus soli]SDS67040.1 carbohydrate ABC transporter membrane protein 2, CUT1 family [Microlunatus soli]
MTTTTLSAEQSETSAVDANRKARDTPGEKIFGGVAHLMLIIWSIIVVVPMLWTLLSSFKTSKEIFASPFKLPAKTQWVNYANAWQQAGIGRAFLNTVIVVGGALLLVMILGAMCAYVLARVSFPGRRAIYYLMLAGLTFPPFLAIVPLFFVLKNFGLLNTLPGLIIVYVAFALPFTVFFLYSFFKTLPYEIGESAAIDGAGEWQTFFLVMLPMARPGMASVAIFNFLGLWNQFLLPIVLNTDKNNWVLSQAIASFASQAGYRTDFGMLFAAVIITIVPVLIIYVIFQRQLQGSVTAGSLK